MTKHLSNLLRHIADWLYKPTYEEMEKLLTETIIGKNSMYCGLCKRYHLKNYKCI
jgi:hypothetical protein